MMKIEREDKIILFIFATIIAIGVYVMWVIETATHKCGCYQIVNRCVESHIETKNRQVYIGKTWYWQTYEDEVCDEYVQVKEECDCVTYHWFWGDVKDYEEN